MKLLAAVDSIVPGQNLSAYVTSVSSIPILTVDQEKALAERLYYQEDLDAAVKNSEGSQKKESGSKLPNVSASQSTNAKGGSAPKNS